MNLKKESSSNYGQLILTKEDITYNLHSGSNTIGDIGCDIRLEPIKFSVQTCCTIEVESNGLAILVKKSKTNEILLNDIPTKYPQILKDEDTFCIAGQKFKYLNKKVCYDNKTKSVALKKKRRQSMASLDTRVTRSRTPLIDKNSGLNADVEHKQLFNTDSEPKDQLRRKRSKSVGHLEDVSVLERLQNIENQSMESMSNLSINQNNTIELPENIKTRRRSSRRHSTKENLSFEVKTEEILGQHLVEFSSANEENLQETILEVSNENIENTSNIPEDLMIKRSKRSSITPHQNNSTTELLENVTIRKKAQRSSRRHSTKDNLSFEVKTEEISTEDLNDFTTADEDSINVSSTEDNLQETISEELNENIENPSSTPKDFMIRRSKRSSIILQRNNSTTSTPKEKFIKQRSKHLSMTEPRNNSATSTPKESNMLRRSKRLSIIVKRNNSTSTPKEKLIIQRSKYLSMTEPKNNSATSTPKDRSVKQSNRLLMTLPRNNSSTPKEIGVIGKLRRSKRQSLFKKINDNEIIDNKATPKLSIISLSDNVDKFVTPENNTSIIEISSTLEEKEGGGEFKNDLTPDNSNKKLKTPINTPKLFENVRFTALKSHTRSLKQNRSKIRRSSNRLVTSFSGIFVNDVNGKGLKKRNRETSSTNSNDFKPYKKLKLDDDSGEDDDGDVDNNNESIIDESLIINESANDLDDEYNEMEVIEEFDNVTKTTNESVESGIVKMEEESEEEQSLKEDTDKSIKGHNLISLHLEFATPADCLKQVYDVQKSLQNGFNEGHADDNNEINDDDDDNGINDDDNKEINDDDNNEINDDNENVIEDNCNFNESLHEMEEEIEKTAEPSDQLEINELLEESEEKNSFKKIKGKIVQKSPKNDLTEIKGLKKLLATPKPFKSPKNDLTQVKGVKKLMATPKRQRSPKNDLTEIGGVKKIMATPKPQKSPKNDLTEVKGVKKIMATPKSQRSPKNDLTEVRGVKKIMATPKPQRSPKNDLTEIKGVKKIMATPKPQKSPKNDLREVKGVKKLMTTPKQQKSPKNNLTEVKGVKQLMKTPKQQKSPKNDLTEVNGVKKLFTTPKQHNSPKNDLTDLEGVKELMTTPNKPQQKSPKNDLIEVEEVKKLMTTPKEQKSPENDLINIEGIKKLLTTKIPKSPLNDLSNISNVNVLFTNEDIDNSFDQLLPNNKPLKTYKGKKSLTPINNNKNSIESSENTNDSSTPIKPHVEKWVEEQTKITNELLNTSSLMGKKLFDDNNIGDENKKQVNSLTTTTKRGTRKRVVKVDPEDDEVENTKTTPIRITRRRKANNNNKNYDLLPEIKLETTFELIKPEIKTKKEIFEDMNEIQNERKLSTFKSPEEEIEKRPRRGGRRKVVVEENGENQDVESIKKTTRGRKKRNVEEIIDKIEDKSPVAKIDDNEEVLVVKRTTRGRNKKVDERTPIQNNEEDGEVVKRNLRGRKKKVVEVKSEPDGEEDAKANQHEEVKKLRGRKKKVVEVKNEPDKEDEDEENQLEEVKKNLRNRKKKVETEENDLQEEEIVKKMTRNRNKKIVNDLTEEMELKQSTTPLKRSTRKKLNDLNDENTPKTKQVSTTSSNIESETLEESTKRSTRGRKRNVNTIIESSTNKIETRSKNNKNKENIINLDSSVDDENSEDVKKNKDTEETVKPKRTRRILKEQDLIDKVVSEPVVTTRQTRRRKL